MVGYITKFFQLQHQQRQTLEPLNQRSRSTREKHYSSSNSERNANKSKHPPPPGQFVYPSHSWLGGIYRTHGTQYTNIGSPTTATAPTLSCLHINTKLPNCHYHARMESGTPHISGISLILRPRRLRLGIGACGSSVVE